MSKVMKQLDGAFSLVILRDKTLIGARDKDGFRPLVLGKIDNSFIIASESSAIEVMGGKYIRDIEPGEIIEIENGKIKKTFKYVKTKKQNTCIFEQVYFSRPDSILFGKTVKESRIKMGELLAKQMKDIIKTADLVMPVPDTGFYAAQGFSREAGILFETGFVRNHYVGRSFIKPSQKLREITAQLKLFPIKEVIEGKEIVLIDDSIVRGTTSRRIIEILRHSGAKKIHFALSCPPIIAPCYYGIDTPMKENLIASQKTIENMRKYLNVASLTFLNLKNLIMSCSPNNNHKDMFCSACFTNKYPTKISRISFKRKIKEKNYQIN
jgi:amidophosphoribosyltransferase